MYQLKIMNQMEEELASANGEEINLFYEASYKEGDYLVLDGIKEPVYLWVQWDDALGRSLVYVTGTVIYRIPFGEKRRSVSPKVFFGEKHLLSIKKARDFEINSYRNLALNVCDQHHMENMYPHAVANVETRGESVFAAQNAIDGVTANKSHGDWPYESWGINRQDDAKIRIDFGRAVCIDRLLLYTRADFPHDNWWTQVQFTFSDGSSAVMKLEKSEKAQEFVFEKRIVDWVEMHDMIKSEEPSPFPALSQIEIYGTEADVCLQNRG